MRECYDPFNGLILLLFGWCAYIDGSVWTSGACTGIGVLMIIDFLDAWAKKVDNTHMEKMKNDAFESEL